MGKFFKLLCITVCAVLLCTSFTACGKDPAAQEQGVRLDCTNLVMKAGEERKLNAVTQSDEKDFVWATDDKNIAEVAQDGTVKAVAEGSAVVSVTLGAKSDYCQITVTEQGEISVDDEIKKDGYIYYEDFEDRNGVPGYYRQSVSGGGSLTVSEGELQLKTAGNGTAFATYIFDEALSGRIVAETRVKVGSTAFSNVLFFYRGEAGYDNNDVIACLGMDAGGFRNNNGSGWGGSIANYTKDTWYEVKMILDIGAGKYSLFINGTQYPDQTFRKRGDGVEDRIKLLKFGTDKSNAQLTYDYIKISGDYSPAVNAENTTYSLSLDKTDTVKLVYNATGTPKPEITVTSDTPFATVASDNKTITFADGTVGGTYMFTVRAENEHGIAEKKFTVIVRADSAVLLDTDFDSLPGGMQLGSTNGTAEVRDGTLVLTTNGSGSVLTSATYDFGVNLSGKVEAETRIMINSSAFLNILFLYNKGTQAIDKDRCTSSVAIEGNVLKYHDGSNWVSLNAAGPISDNTYYTLRVVYDFDNYTMDIWVGDTLVLNGGKMRKASDETAVLIMGSDKTGSSMTYDYLKFTYVTD